MTRFELIQIISGTFGSFGFSILFNIRGRRLPFAVLGGFLSWCVYVLFDNLGIGEVLNYFLVAILVSAYAEIMARRLKSPTTTFIMPSLIPLIPGASLYYTMRYAFEGLSDAFATKAIYTLELASALALGIIIASAVSKAVFGLRAKYQKKKSGNA